MKKIFISITLVISILFINMSSVYAAEEMSFYRENMRHQQIDKVINELNRLAAIKSYYSYMAEMGMDLDELLSDTCFFNESTFQITEGDYEQRKLELEQELETLDVKKVDPMDSEDMAMLEEMKDSNCYGDLAAYSGVFDMAPDLSLLANVYTVYQYEGSVTRNGVLCNYRYFRVVDNKGYGQLNSSHKINAIGPTPGEELRDKLLKYNFEYVLTGLIGKLPYGMVTNWVLGNVFTILNDPSLRISSTTNDPIYQILHFGVTEMNYYYMYNNGWRLIGVGATTSAIRTDILMCNVNGKPHQDINTSEFDIRTDGVWYDYLDSYTKHMDFNASYCRVDTIGKIEIKGYSEYGSFEPAYGRYPTDLM